MKVRKWKAFFYVVLGMLVLMCSQNVVKASGSTEEMLTLNPDKTYLIYAALDAEGNPLQEKSEALYDDGGTVSWIKHGGW